MLSLTSLISIGATLIGSIAFLAVRRLVLSPLSRFPGPKLAALTGWYITYYEAFKDGALVAHLEKLHEVYGEWRRHLTVLKVIQRFVGPVVRFGPNEVSLADHISIRLTWA
jgi:hypothetical protein